MIKIYTPKHTNCTIFFKIFSCSIYASAPPAHTCILQNKDIFKENFPNNVINDLYKLCFQNYTVYR